MKYPSLFQKRKIYFPTPLGLAMILVILFIFAFFFLKNIYSFLAITKPVDSSVYIVEGWVPDYCLEIVYEKYKAHSISLIFVTGGPLEQGSFLKEYKSFAGLGATSLRKLGIPDSMIIEVSSPYVQKDRTFTSALCLKKWFSTHKKNFLKINVITLGVHARRSQILFQKAFSSSLKIGVISIPDRDYNPSTWYLSSIGLKTVLIEIISFIYTEIYFIHSDLK